MRRGQNVRAAALDRKGSFKIFYYDIIDRDAASRRAETIGAAFGNFHGGDGGARRGLERAEHGVGSHADELNVSDLRRVCGLRGNGYGAGTFDGKFNISPCGRREVELPGMYMHCVVA